MTGSFGWTLLCAVIAIYFGFRSKPVSEKSGTIEPLLPGEISRRGWQAESELTTSSLPRQIERKPGTDPKWTAGIFILFLFGFVIWLIVSRQLRIPSDRKMWTSIALFPLYGVIIGYQLIAQYRKTRYLVQWGKVVGARVDQIAAVGRGARRAYLTYESDGTVQAASSSLPQNNTLTPGEIVSAFVDDRYPNEAVVYRTCSYRITRG